MSFEAAQRRPRAISRSGLSSLLASYHDAAGYRWEREASASPRLNPWTVLGLEREEIRHSRVLAWLLDRSETHAQQGLFLKHFVAALRLTELTDACAEQPYSVSTEVRGEHARIDIEVHGSDFLVHIENKVEADEGDRQTHREANDLRRAAAALGVPAQRAVGVFLTPQGRSGESDLFRTMSWAAAVTALENALAEIRAQRPGNVKVIWFVEQYLVVVRQYMLQERSRDVVI